jgi:hypothetical protein
MADKLRKLFDTEAPNLGSLCSNSRPVKVVCPNPALLWAQEIKISAVTWQTEDRDWRMWSERD